MTLCECGCGGEAKPGRRFIYGHNLRINNPKKVGKKLSKEAKEKFSLLQKETKRLNKLIKEGKMELSFCACGCGGRVTKIGNRYIRGHSGRGKQSPKKGKTKETDEGLRKAGEKRSKTLKAFYATEEGQKWLDEHNRGENAPMYGVKPWNYGETKETDGRLEIAGEKISKTHKEFFQTDEGQQWIDNNMRDVNNSVYGKVSPKKGQTKETNESIRRQAEKIGKFMIEFYQTDRGIEVRKQKGESQRGDKNPAKRPEVREKISINKKEYFQTEEGIRRKQIMSDFFYKNWQDPEFIKKMTESWTKKPSQLEKDITNIVQNLLPNEYKYNGNFELGITIGGKIPDFVNINGKKKAIDAFGDYWHEGEDPQIRIDLFKEYGWDLLVIWEHELKDRDAVIQKILKFHGVKSDYILTQKTLDTWIDNKDKITEKREGEP